MATTQTLTLVHNETLEIVGAKLGERVVAKPIRYYRESVMLLIEIDLQRVIDCLFDLFILASGTSRGRLLTKTFQMYYEVLWKLDKTFLDQGCGGCLTLYTIILLFIFKFFCSQILTD